MRSDGVVASSAASALTVLPIGGRPGAARGRFVLNVASNLGYVVLSVAVMFWYVPFLIGHVGVAAYGVISLVNALVAYSALVTASLETSTNRYLAIEIGSGRPVQARRIFNTALALCLAACAALAVVASLVAVVLPIVFNVPTGLEVASQILFASFGLATAATLLGGTFSAPAVVMHRFELRSLVRAATLLSRVGVVALCFWIWPPSLYAVAAAFALSAVINLLGDVLIWRRLAPELWIDRHDVRFDRMKDLAGFGGWSAVNQAGHLLMVSVDLLIVNAIFGATVTGRYASLLLFPALLQTLVETVATVLSPIILACYARADVEGLRRVAMGSVKLLGLGLAVPIGLLCGFGGPLLGLWLGPDFESLHILLIVLVVHLVLVLALRPLAYVITAYGRVRGMALVTVAFGAANLALAIALALWGPWGAVGVAVAGAVCWTAKNVAFLSVYSARLMGMRWWVFLPSLGGAALATLGVAVAGWLVATTWPPTSWSSLLGAMILTGLVVSILLAAGIGRADRDLIFSLLKRGAHA